MPYRPGIDPFNEEEYLKHYALKDKDGKPLKMVENMEESIKRRSKILKELERRNIESNKPKNTDPIRESKDVAKGIDFNKHEDEVWEDVILSAL